LRPQGPQGLRGFAYIILGGKFMLTVKINEVEYPLATTLRVAYKIQGQHNHKPYTEVFKSIGTMVLEDQIGILYAAFECANPEQVGVIKRQNFLDAYLDNYNLKIMMDHIQGVIKGIMGEDFFDDDEKENNDDTVGATDTEGDEAKN
jgi:hypothetical protein